MTDRFRIAVEIMDGVTRQATTEVLEALTTEPGWRCRHALWPDWLQSANQTNCGRCRQALEPCKLVVCPWRQWLPTSATVATHFREGCPE